MSYVDQLLDKYGMGGEGPYSDVSSQNASFVSSPTVVKHNYTPIIFGSVVIGLLMAILIVGVVILFSVKKK